MTDWYTALSFVTLLAASLYVLLLAPANAYRFKRIMFNSQANGKYELANVVALRHRSRREGLYLSKLGSSMRLECLKPGRFNGTCSSRCFPLYF